MSELQEEDEECKDLTDSPRPCAPNKKKFEEDMESLSAVIRTKEAELESIKAAGSVNVQEEQKKLRAEKSAHIEHRKKIDADLQKLNKEIPEMMKNLSRLESSLHYRSEDRINEAVRRLEWNLSAQNFKLSEERKIVAEIDSLRRSKKTLVQYQAQKREVDETRAKQRRMRDERDTYFRKVTDIKREEEKIRAESIQRRSEGDKLKRELDELYESRRQMVAAFKKQREEFQDQRERRRHESFKKREEEKKKEEGFKKREEERKISHTAPKRERPEVDNQKQPQKDLICLCNTLIQYLSRFVSNTDLEPSIPAVTASPISSPSSEDSPALGQTQSGFTSKPEQLEDGQYVLLRKSEADDYVTGSAKPCARKQRRSRKNSMAKRVTHPPEVVAQFVQLNLRVPSTVSEILVSLEQLSARKLFYERECEVESEAELSVTESAAQEMSRQASHTESSDGLIESVPQDAVVKQLLQLSDSPAGGQAEGADAGQVESDCFHHSHESTGESGTVPPPTPPPASSGEGYPRSRPEGSDSSPHSSSTLEEGRGEGEDLSVAESESGGACSQQQTPDKTQPSAPVEQHRVVSDATGEVSFGSAPVPGISSTDHHMLQSAEQVLRPVQQTVARDSQQTAPSIVPQTSSSGAQQTVSLESRQTMSSDAPPTVPCPAQSANSSVRSHHMAPHGAGDMSTDSLHCTRPHSADDKSANLDLGNTTCHSTASVSGKGQPISERPTYASKVVKSAKADLVSRHIHSGGEGRGGQVTVSAPSDLGSKRVCDTLPTSSGDNRLATAQNDSTAKPSDLTTSSTHLSPLTHPPPST